MRKKVLLTLFMICMVFLSCRKDVPMPLHIDAPDPGEPQPASPVNFDPATVPYATLAEYNLFQGDPATLEPVYGVLPYDVITPLFSDHASKKRFIWMPDSVRATFNGEHEAIGFPENTLLIKNFYYDNVHPAGNRRIIETRLMFLRNGTWEFADYVWNSAQTEAVLDLGGSITPVTFTDDQGIQRSIDYRIPAAAECHTCHKSNNTPIPIGPKPRNLDTTFPYSTGTMNQLDKWVEAGYLEEHSGQITPVVPWDDATQDLRERVRSYLDMNCAHCHSDGGHCDYRPVRFAYEETINDANLGICVTPHEPILPHHSHIVSKGNVERSVLHYRLGSTQEAERMPLLGRTVVHEKALQMIADWIVSMPPPCN